MTARENEIHAKRDQQKREAWIKNVMNSLKYTRERAEQEHDKIFKKK